MRMPPAGSFGDAFILSHSWRMTGFGAENNRGESVSSWPVADIEKAFQFYQSSNDPWNP